jgi:hypothetical protein
MAHLPTRRGDSTSHDAQQQAAVGGISPNIPEYALISRHAQVCLG